MTSEPSLQIGPDALLQRYQTLLSVSDAIQGCRDLGELFRKLATQVRQVVAYDAIAIARLDERGENFRIELLESWVPQQIDVGFSVPRGAVPAGWVVEQQKPLRMRTADNDPRFPLHNEQMRKTGFAVSFHLPLTTPRAKLGELIFAFREDVQLPDAEVEFMQRVANQVAAAIENASNFEAAHSAHGELERANQQRETLLTLTNKIVTQLDLQEVLRTAARSVRSIVPCAICAVALPTSDEQHLRLVTLEYPNGKGFIKEGLLLPTVGSNVGRAFTTRQAIVLDSVDPKNYTPEMFRFLEAEGLKAQCFVPLMSRGRALGVLGMSRTEDGLFTPQEVEFLKSVAAQITIAVENAMQVEEIRSVERDVARERDRKQLLLELTNSAISQLDLQQVLDVVAKGVRTVVPADLAIVSLLDDDGAALRVRAIDFPKGKGFIQNRRQFCQSHVLAQLLHVFDKD